MGEMVYNALSSYYNALEKTGYMPYGHAIKLLVLLFYNDFVFSDFRGLLCREDYRTIERALDCLYGSTCLIPYPDYLKMGKLHLGDTTELAQRIKAIEDTEVVKTLLHPQNSDSESDIVIVAED